jgi:hypothetical protein
MRELFPDKEVSTLKKQKEISKVEQESKYLLQELVEGAPSVFGFSANIMWAALVHGGKTEYTKTEAKALAEKFAKKEVKI